MVIIVENCNSAQKKDENEYEKILMDLILNQTFEESPFERIFDKINTNECSYIS